MVMHIFTLSFVPAYAIADLQDDWPLPSNSPLLQSIFSLIESFISGELQTTFQKYTDLC